MLWGGPRRIEPSSTAGVQGLEPATLCRLAGASGAGFGPPLGRARLLAAKRFGDTPRPSWAYPFAQAVRKVRRVLLLAPRVLPEGIFNSSAVKTSSTAASLATTFELWPL